MIMYVADNRQIYQRAKDDFTNSRRRADWRDAPTYWEAFGAANGMRVSIRRWIKLYPVVEALEFSTEADYAWFMLRYS